VRRTFVKGFFRCVSVIRMSFIYWAGSLGLAVLNLRGFNEVI